MDEQDEPHWAILLQYFYENDVPTIGPATLEPNKSHPFVVQTDLEKNEAVLAIQYLWQTGLIERFDMGEETQGWRLTQSGFDVAHDRNMARQDAEQEDQRVQQQNDVNRSIAFLTIGILFISGTDMVINALIGIDAYNIVIQTVMVIGAIVLLSVITYISRGELL